MQFSPPFLCVTIIKMKQNKKGRVEMCKKLVAGIISLSVIFVPLTPVFAFTGVLPVPVNAANPALVQISLSNTALSKSQTATVTFTFAVAPPASFSAGSITASNGNISNLAVTANPLIYTATFTPTDNYVATANVISVNIPLATTTYGVGTSTAPNGIAFDGTNIWITNYTGNSVTKISSAGATTTYSLGAGAAPTGIAYDGTNMWSSNLLNNSVTKISPAGATTTYSNVGSTPQAIVFDGTNMWIANNAGNSVTKITPLGATSTYSVGVGTNPVAIAFDGTNMWTANISSNSVTKI